MKKAAQTFTFGLLGVLSAAFFIPSVSFAQSGHFVILSQGVLTASSTSYDGSDHATWTMVIPFQGTASTTGAFLTLDTRAVNFNSSFQNARVDLTCSDGRQSTFQTSSSFNSQPLASTTPTFIPLTAGDGFFTSTSTCTVVVTLTNVAGHSLYLDYFGAPLNPHPDWSISGYGTGTAVVLPYFAIVADNFQITPTASSSGLYLSGAQAFCADRFSSSSNPVSGLVNDFGNAMCQALGYLFIPTSDSWQQFSLLVPMLQTRIPFSYFYGLYGVYDGLTASSTENLPTLSVNFPSLGTSTPLGQIVPSHFDLLSTTTIDKYYPTSTRQTFLFLGSLALWMWLAYELYHRVVPHKVL